MEFLKKIVKNTTKVTGKTVKAVTTSVIDGIDETINGDDIKEIRKLKAENTAIANQIKKVQKEKERKENSLEMKVWLFSFGLSVVYVLYTMYMNNFNSKLIEQNLNPLIIVAFLLIAFIYSIAKMIGRA